MKAVQIPRRNRIDLMVPAELAIRTAMLEVEKMPADMRLTSAIIKLGEARDHVGDFVDANPPPGEEAPWEPGPELEAAVNAEASRCLEAIRADMIEAGLSDREGAATLGTREMVRRLLLIVKAQDALINAPETADFVEGVKREAAHQRARWASNHDAGKTPADWFWLVGYLAGKALHSITSGDLEKGLHHVITTAAALCNWHAHMKGKTNMRPGIAPPAGEGL